MTATTIFTVIAGLLALLAGAVYLFGIPPQLKRAMEEKALETMGENKASYLMKGMCHCLIMLPLASTNLSSDQINKIPASDQQDVKDLKKGLGNALGGSLQNPLGKEVGNAGDQLTSPLTGR